MSFAVSVVAICQDTGIHASPCAVLSASHSLNVRGQGAFFATRQAAALLRIGCTFARKVRCACHIS